MREFLWHLWNMDERVPPIVYQPGQIAQAEEAVDTAAAQSLEEVTAFCQAADIVMVTSSAERELLMPHHISRIEVFSDAAVQTILEGLAS
jgi:hypothetical protein